MADALRRRELWAAPLCEAALILLAAVAAWLTRAPLIFASLGPTAFELVETPERRSSRPYSVIVGHLVGLVAGFSALAVTDAWHAPAIPSGSLAWPRVFAVALGALLTVLGTLLADATQPAAISTSMLVTLGLMQTLPDAGLILISVVLMVFAAEPLRRWRERAQTRLAEKEGPPAGGRSASESGEARRERA